MINFSKKFLFILLILSFGLVLSACGNKLAEEQKIKNNGEIIPKSSQQKNQEVISEEIDSEEINEEDNVDLDLAKWRVYENEYFNLKFKYHNNWYFQRDDLNAENYIAVYGFAPSAEELSDKNYAIKLFILNLENNFSENFTYSQKKENGNKKYILVSNQEKHQEILDLMFENIEFLDEEENISFQYDKENICGVEISLPKFLDKNTFIENIWSWKSVCSFSDNDNRRWSFIVSVLDKDKVLDIDVYKRIFDNYDEYESSQDPNILEDICLPPVISSSMGRNISLFKNFDTNGFNGVAYLGEHYQDSPGAGVYQIVKKQDDKLIYITYLLFSHDDVEWNEYLEKELVNVDSNYSEIYNKAFNNYRANIIESENISKNIEELNNIYNFKLK